MAKKLVPLSFLDIVLQADAETIREALAARTQIDGLLVEREEAYRKIDALEQQIEELVGEEGVFVYPEAPVPVAGFNKVAASTRPKPVKKVEAPAENADEKKGAPADNAEGKKEEAKPAAKEETPTDAKKPAAKEEKQNKPKK